MFNRGGSVILISIMKIEILMKSPNLGDLYTIESDKQISLNPGSMLPNIAGKIIKKTLITGGMKYCYLVTIA